VVVVPIQVGLAAADNEPTSADGGEPAGQRFLTGRLVLAGETSPFRLEMDQRPEIVWLDRYGEVFGRFFAASRWPRRAAYLKGLELVAEGDAVAAEEAFLEAFRQPVLTDPEEAVGLDFDLERATWAVDASIHVALAELYLGERRLEAAMAQLTAARQIIPRSDRWLMERRLVPLEARLDLLSGDVDGALRRLERELGKSRQIGSADAWALYAVAAHLSSNGRDDAEACRGALDRGVDLGPLPCP